ncbi:hypothetical protein [Staphylococcus phage vB_StaM_SA1]|nr:hypothetical protein [Staphylococcus phage vB_StaM_SA1]
MNKELSRIIKITGIVVTTKWLIDIIVGKIEERNFSKQIKSS